MKGHTPGPWRHSLPHADGSYVVVARCGRRVGVLDRLADAQDARNAELIAAAPDMLAALESARRRMADIGCCYGRDDDFTAVCDAIARAGGKQP